MLEKKLPLSGCPVGGGFGIGAAGPGPEEPPAHDCKIKNATKSAPDNRPETITELKPKLLFDMPHHRMPQGLESISRPAV